MYVWHNLPILHNLDRHNLHISHNLVWHNLHISHNLVWHNLPILHNLAPGSRSSSNTHHFLFVLDEGVEESDAPAVDGPQQNPGVEGG